MEKEKSLFDYIKKKDNLQREIDAEPISIEGSYKAPEPKRKIAGAEVPSAAPESSSFERDWGPLLIGATPLLAGLITNNMADGYGVASTGLLDEADRRYKRQDKLIDIIRKRKDSGIGRLYEVRDPETGAITYKTAEEASGNLAPYRRRPVDESTTLAEQTTEAREGVRDKYGANRKLTEDEEKRKVVYDRKSNTYVPIDGYKPTEEVSPYFRDRSDKLADKFIADMKPQRDAYQELTSASNLIQSSGQLPQKVALMSIVKKLEGRMTDEDRNYYTGSVGLFEEIGERYKQAKNAEIRQRLLGEGQEVLKEMIEYTEGRIEGEAESRAKSLSRTKDEKSYLLKKFGAGQFKSKQKPTPKSYKVRHKDTGETYMIERKDLEAAKKDRFQVVK